MVLYDRARVGPTTKTSDEISILCLFRLILQAKSFVLFYLWYSSCFEVKCWIHTFQAVFSNFYESANPSCLSRLSCQFFPTGVLLFKWIRSFSTSARSILSFLNVVRFIRPQVAFVFPRSHPFFSKESDFLIKYPFIHVKSIHSFQSMFLPGDYHEVGQEFQVRHSLLFSSPVD